MAQFIDAIAVSHGVCIARSLRDQSNAHATRICRALTLESEKMRALHLEALEKLTGVRHVVLDFIETGGIPPSVEALYAWLEFRYV